MSAIARSYMVSDIIAAAERGADECVVTLTEPEFSPDDFFGHGWYPDSKPRQNPQPDPTAVARLAAAEVKRARKAKKRLGVLP